MTHCIALRRALNLGDCRHVPCIDRSLMALSSLHALSSLNLQGQQHLGSPLHMNIDQASSGCAVHLPSGGACNAGCQTLTDVGLVSIAHLTALCRVDLQHCSNITGETLHHELRHLGITLDARAMPCVEPASTVGT